VYIIIIIAFFKFLNIIIIECKNKVIPLIIETTGTTSSFKKYLNSITGKHEMKELQKTAILGTAHLLWKVLI